jgi:putative membrane protein
MSDGQTREPSDDEPDPRFTFANERTFLAWHRTALALIGAGLAVTQVFPPFDIPGLRRIIGLPLIVLGGLIAFTSYSRWDSNQAALRRGDPLPSHWVNKAIGVVIGLSAVGALLAAAFGGS